MTGADCELGLAWIIGTFIVGMSFGACVGTVVAGLCSAAKGAWPDPSKPIDGDRDPEALRRALDGH
jgi:hypothetical protein